MKKIFLIFILVTLISHISASCSEGQIDINTATKEELDELYGIGPVKAQNIINSRNFSSVNDLINVNGIGEITLNKIKNQGLACADNEEDNKESEEIENNEKEETPEIFSEEKETQIESKQNNEDKKTEEVKDIKIKAEVIKLIPKDIKTDENTESSNKNIYAIYGFVFFCILLAFLFLLRKKKFKNEFD